MFTGEISHHHPNLYFHFSFFFFNEGVRSCIFLKRMLLFLETSKNLINTTVDSFGEKLDIGIFLLQIKLIDLS